VNSPPDTGHGIKASNLHNLVVVGAHKGSKVVVTDKRVTDNVAVNSGEDTLHRHSHQISRM
jgi:predicted RNA-binding protein with TRAM domain